MPGCDAAHAAFDAHVGKEITVGPLPEWTRIQGRVAWVVVRGPYSGLNQSWMSFMGQLSGKKIVPRGPCGDVYTCQLPDHESDGGSKLLTILYAPVR